MLERLPSSYAHFQHSSKRMGIWDGFIASLGLLLNLFFLFELCLSLGCLETNKILVRKHFPINYTILHWMSVALKNI